jgi:hypothetical protein
VISQAYRCFSGENRDRMITFTENIAFGSKETALKFLSTLSVYNIENKMSNPYPHRESNPDITVPSHRFCEGTN